MAGTDQKPLTQELLEKAVSVESSTRTDIGSTPTSLRSLVENAEKWPDNQQGLSPSPLELDPLAASSQVPSEPQDIAPATPASKQEDVPLQATAPATGDASRATRGGDQADKNNMPPPEPPNLYWKYAGLHIGLVDGNAHCTTLCMNSFYYWPRMYRYFKPKADGSPKCSKEALDLYQSDEGRALVEPPKNNFPCTKTGFLTCFGVGACIYAIVRF